MALMLSEVGHLAIGCTIVAAIGPSIGKVIVVDKAVEFGVGEEPMTDGLAGNVVEHIFEVKDKICTGECAFLRSINVAVKKVEGLVNDGGNPVLNANTELSGVSKKFGKARAKMFEDNFAGKPAIRGTNTDGTKFGGVGGIFVKRDEAACRKKRLDGERDLIVENESNELRKVGKEGVLERIVRIVLFRIKNKK